jgi:hypothetical protein
MNGGSQHILIITITTGGITTYYYYLPTHNKHDGIRIFAPLDPVTM